MGQQVTYTVEWLATGWRDTDPSDEVVGPLRDVRAEVVLHAPTPGRLPFTVVPGS